MKNIIANTATLSQYQKRNNAKTKALNDVTLLYKVERVKSEKGGKQKGVGKIAQAKNENYKTSVLGQMVMSNVTSGMVGQSPLKIGPGGSVPCNVFKF